MGADKERFQNPVIGDDITLRLLTFNSNNRADVDNITKVDIYFLDDAERTEENPDGRRLVETITSTVHDETGAYSIKFTLTSPKYTIGKYIDIWTFVIDPLDADAIVTNQWELYPALWYTSPVPIAYDFNFNFRPNKIRSGAKRWLIIAIEPNVPKATDLARYYENIAITSPLKVYIEQECGPCVPAESDLRLIVDGEPIVFREKLVGYYQLDTTDMNCGIYNVWFEMAFGDSIYISDKEPLQIFD